MAQKKSEVAKSKLKHELGYCSIKLLSGLPDELAFKLKHEIIWTGLTPVQLRDKVREIMEMLSGAMRKDQP